MANTKKLRDVTAEETKALPDKYASTFEYLLEQIKGLENQAAEIAKATNLTKAMLQDVVQRGGKDLELDAEKWTFDLDTARYRLKTGEEKPNE